MNVGLKGALGALAILGSLATTSIANAASGYVCYTAQFPNAIYGSYGGVVFQLYSQPDCAGDYVGTYDICSSGATASLCTKSTTYVYSESQLQAYATMLHDASIAGTRVVVVVSTSCNSATSCFIYSHFWAS